jgi:hypothetical protein
MPNPIRISPIITLCIFAASVPRSPSVLRSGEIVLRIEFPALFYSVLVVDFVVVVMLFGIGSVIG